MSSAFAAALQRGRQEDFWLDRGQNAGRQTGRGSGARPPL